MTTLYLDFGNTRVKWYLSSGESGVQSYDLFHGWFQEMRSDGSIETAVIASVLADERQDVLNASMRRNSEVSLQRCVVTREALGVRCAYSDLTRLGIDRWLAVVAVWQRFRVPCLVADLGTAATMDFVGPDGAHQGGFIVSGLQLALRGLLAGTDNIRPDPAGFAEATLAPGVNTSEAIYHGALHSLVALIQSGYQNLLKSSPEAKLILAGGDAPLVGSHLSFSYELIEDLVYEGMRLLEHANLLVDA